VVSYVRREFLDVLDMVLWGRLAVSSSLAQDEEISLVLMSSPSKLSSSWQRALVVTRLGPGGFFSKAVN
jgi:hypothetical protein